MKKRIYQFSTLLFLLATIVIGLLFTFSIIAFPLFMGLIVLCSVLTLALFIKAQLCVSPNVLSELPLTEECFSALPPNQPDDLENFKESFTAYSPTNGLQDSNTPPVFPLRHSSASPPRSPFMFSDARAIDEAKKLLLDSQLLQDVQRTPENKTPVILFSLYHVPHKQYLQAYQDAIKTLETQGDHIVRALVIHPPNQSDDHGGIWPERFGICEGTLDTALMQTDQVVMFAQRYDELQYKQFNPSSSSGTLHEIERPLRATPVYQ